MGWGLGFILWFILFVSFVFMGLIIKCLFDYLHPERGVGLGRSTDVIELFDAYRSRSG